MSKKYSLIAAGLLLAVFNSPAASGDWINNAASVWSAATNWSSDPVVPGTAAGDVVGLTYDITASRTITIDTTSRTVGTLNIGDPASGYFVYRLASSDGGTLTFDNNGNGALLAKPNAGNTALDVIAAPIVLADDLTIDTAVTGADNSGLSLEITTVISENGSRRLIKNGVGGVRLNGANTYSGGAILNAGEVQLGSSFAFGAGPLTINGGSLASRIASRNITNAVTVNGDFTLNSARAGGNALTLSGSVDLGGETRTITVASSANPSAYITGNISAANPSVGLIKAGISVLNLAGANTFSGDTRIAEGNLQLSPSPEGPAGTSIALQYSTVDLDAADVGKLSFRGSVGTVAAVLGGLKGSRDQDLINSSGNPVTLTIGNNNQSTTYSGVLSGARANLVKVGNGTLTLTGANTYDFGTVINGGSLQLGDGGSTGSLHPLGYIENYANLTVNRNDTVVQGTDFGGGSISGSGSFTQAGTGTTILNNFYQCSGPMVVNAGRLVISTDQSYVESITVANGAALGITVGYAQFQPGVLTLGAGAGCILEFSTINNPGTTVAALVPGSMTRNGTVTVNVRSINGAIVQGGSGYPLLGNVSGTVAGYVLGIQPPGVNGHLTVSSGTLTYVVDSMADTWASGDPMNPTFWDVGVSANWAGNAANNTPPNTFANGDSVLFNDGVWGPQAVTVVAAVMPSEVNVDNAATEYSIASSGGNITGSATLNKSGTGTLNLSGPNTYTGGTTLSAGQLNINDGGTSSANSPIGTGPLTIKGGTLGNMGWGDVTLLSNNEQFWNGDFGYAGGYNLNLGTGSVTPNAHRQINVSAGTLTVGGAIGGGAISLTKSGEGALTLSGANTFSGGMILAAGQLNINNGGTSAANSAIGTGALTILGGIIDNTSGSDLTLLPNNPVFWDGNFSYAGSANSLNLGTGPVYLASSRSVTVDANTLTIAGLISGPGGLAKAGMGALALMNANTYGDAGSVDTDVTGGTLVLGHDFALGYSRLDIADGVTIQSADSSTRVITNRLNFGSGAGGNNFFTGTGKLVFTASAANGTSKITTVNNPMTEFSGALSGNMARTIAGTGITVFSGANTYGQGTTINPGATLQLGNGGTSGSLSTSGAIVNDGTLIFNRSDALVQGTHFSSAPITGSGSVVQAGTGTTTLSAANTYSGLTTVSSGGLLISPAYQAGGEVIVANGARFGVVAESVSASAKVGNLTLGSGGETSLDFSYFLEGNPANPALEAGAVTVNGNCVVRIGGVFAVGTFPVLKYGSLSGSFSSTVVAPRGVEATLSNDASTQTLYVTVTSVDGGAIVWKGSDSVLPNVWDLNTTENWLDGESLTVYDETLVPGDAVMFDDSGSGVVVLDNTATPARVIIDNDEVDYWFQGTGRINSAAGLTKLGAGSVTIDLPGNYKGSTVLSNGPIILNGASQTLANLSGDSALTNAGSSASLVIQNSADTTYAGDISGPLTFTKAGEGELTLTSSNGIVGNVFVKAGTLTLDSGVFGIQGYASVAHNGSDNGTLTLRGTAVFTNNNDFNVGDVISSVGTVNIEDDAVLTVNSFFIGSANNAGSTASGTVNQNGGTVTELSGANGAFSIGGRTEGTSVGGVGVYNLNAGTLIATAGIRVGSAGQGTFNQNGGTLIANSDVNIARLVGSSGTYNLNGGTMRTRRVTSSTGVNAIFNFNGGVIEAVNPQSPFFQSLTAAYVQSGGAIFDTLTNQVTVTQSLMDGGTGGGLTKLGAGTLYLDGYNTYTGQTVVSNGVLAGIGVISGPVSVKPEGAIGAGAANNIGTLTISGNLTIEGGAMLRINKTGGVLTSDLVSVGGAVVYGGTLVVTNITSDGTPITTDDTFQVFSAAAQSGTFANIVGSPGSGLAYSFADGVLSVVPGTPTDPTDIVFSISSGEITLSWPVEYTGWTLQVQTNSVDVGLSTNWHDVPGSADSNSITLPVDPSNGAVFYRLKMQ